MMHKEEMEIGGLTIEIVRKRNLKNLYIRVNPPEGDVTVSSPMELKDEDIRLFILKKLPEITKVRDRMVAQERQSKREYVSGESIIYGADRIVYRSAMRVSNTKL